MLFWHGGGGEGGGVVRPPRAADSKGQKRGGKMNMQNDRLLSTSIKLLNQINVNPINDGNLTLTLLMSYIYGAPILDVSRSHTTTQHSR